MNVLNKEVSSMILETKRLRLRNWRVGEEAVLKTFLGSDEVMYAYEGGFDDLKIANWLSWNLKLYQEKGYGLWAIERKSDGKIIGECGLTDQTIDGKTYVEIGYHLIASEWHKGYMMEATQAVKNYAFEILRVAEVVSIIRDTNLASMNVAIRNGMTVTQRIVKQYSGIEMPHYIFKVKKRTACQKTED
ncbi:hypothetical protein RV04_GL001125 [Enterococcus hermanniensis]|uniref:N-acetyltransferase domain-containing protein n=2 Tax=Enterococcus hermanniensis TaxID=249189 RepID=A0A1L8TQY1_9ENTE|nr:hypothetical protein RV04_GL001125 [Enterococcus hermanniensis]